jgi:hypothetical protein
VCNWRDIAQDVWLGKRLRFYDKEPKVVANKVRGVNHNRLVFRGKGCLICQCDYARTLTARVKSRKPGSPVGLIQSCGTDCLLENDVRHGTGKLNIGDCVLDHLCIFQRWTSIKYIPSALVRSRDKRVRPLLHVDIAISIFILSRIVLRRIEP